MIILPNTNYAYWYDKTYGFGILLPTANKKSGYRGFFLDGKIHDIDPKSGCSVLNSFVGYYSRALTIDVSYETEKDPEKLLQETTFTITPDAKNDSLSITVQASGLKSQTVTLEDGYFSCTCQNAHTYYYRYQRTCTHIYRAALFLKKGLYDINHAFVTSTLPELSKDWILEFSLVDKFKAFPNKEYPYDQAREMVDMLVSAHSDSYITEFYFYMVEQEPSYYEANFLSPFTPLFIAMIDNPVIHHALIDSEAYDEKSEWGPGRQGRSNRLVFKRCLKNYDRAVKELEKGNYREFDYEKETKLTLLAIRCDWQGILRFYADSGNTINDSDVAIINKIKDNVTIDDATADYLCSLLLNLDQSKHITISKEILFSGLVPLLPKEKKVGVLKKLKTLKVDVAAIKDLEPKEQLAVISHVDITSEALDYIFSTVLKDAEDKAKGKYLLSTIAQVRGKWAFKEDDSRVEKYLSYAMKLANPRILYSYLWYEIYGDQCKQLPSAATTLQEEIEPYFTTGFEFDQKKSEPTCYFSLTNPYLKDDRILIVKEQGSKLELDYGNRALNIDKEQFRSLCLQNRVAQYEEAKEKEKERIDNENFSHSHKEFVDDLRSLTKGLLDEQKVIFSESAKATIEYSFFYESNSAAVSFRVGNSRFYQVKDALDFIAAFKKRDTVTYGRDLILTHDEANLVPQDAQVIKLLTASRLSSGKKDDPKNKRYATISPQLFSSMLDMLKGRTVFYNGEKTLIRLDKVSFRVGIDKEYRLFSTMEDKQSLLQLGNKGYIYNSNAIDLLDNSVEEMKLIGFFSTHKDVSIKPIVPEFKRNLYAKHASFIDIANEIKPSFKLSEITINAYFDYHEHKISVRTKLEKDEKPVKEEELKSYDKDKIAAYQRYLDALGFDAEGIMDDDAKVLSFFRMDFSQLRKLCSVYLSESLSNKQLISMTRQVFRITYKSGLMDLFLEKSDFTQSELEEILKGLRLKKKYVLLKGNRIVDLDNQDAKDFEETVTDFGMDEKDLFSKKQIPMATAIKAFAHERNCHADTYLRNMIEDLRNFKNADLPLPSLHAKLRNYQREGFNWLTILSSYNLGGVLADDMGLGKTLQIIAMLKADKLKMPSLVICPKSLIFNWKSEILRFDGKTETIEIYGPEQTRTKLISEIDYSKKTIYVTSYESFRIDCQKYTGKFAYAILDEAQFIKNVYAQKTRSVKTIDAIHRYALTGTPIENSVVDLWSIFDFIMPGYLEDLSLFKQAEHDAIRRKVSPFILRRTKEDVLTDLPAKFERVITADMGIEQRKLYESVRDKASKALAEGGKAFDILPYLTRLRQICIDPAMYMEGFPSTGAKMELLKTMIPESLQEGHRILVFSQFVTALLTLKEMLEKQNIPCYLLTGDTPAKDRISLANSFNEGEGADVFLISLKAGGTGLNLIGADTVIHLDPWWNVAAEDQADDRTHRIGQTRNVEVIKLIAAHSIEQRVLELQDIKKDIIDKVISHDDSSVVNATLEDIAFILK